LARRWIRRSERESVCSCPGLRYCWRLRLLRGRSRPLLHAAYLESASFLVSLLLCPRSAVFFASSDLATHLAGYMDGAIQSGERAAHGILVHLAKRGAAGAVSQPGCCLPFCWLLLCSPCDAVAFVAGASGRVRGDRDRSRRQGSLCSPIHILQYRDSR
jgi:hypothetical protein